MAASDLVFWRTRQDSNRDARFSKGLTRRRPSVPAVFECSAPILVSIGHAEEHRVRFLMAWRSASDLCKHESITRNGLDDGSVPRRRDSREHRPRA